jgi:hypothetical protein
MQVHQRIIQRYSQAVAFFSSPKIQELKGIVELGQNNVNSFRSAKYNMFSSTTSRKK